jgi:hypothetical protein
MCDADLCLSRNHIGRCLSLAIIVDAGPNEKCNLDSETRRHETMVRSTLSNFTNLPLFDLDKQGRMGITCEEYKARRTVGGHMRLRQDTARTMDEEV